MDVFFYAGQIDRSYDLKFIECVAAQNDKSKAKECLVVMTSGGGNPDAAYKIARYLQHRYESYSVLVAGFCNSAATLFAIGAKELVFCPFGELGPLDIQLQKPDSLSGFESGLNIGEAFTTLESQARQTYNDMLMEIIRNSGGVVTFKTASDVVTDMVSVLYGPIFAQIDPEEMGSRTRAMRIGEDYAKRLNQYGNLKTGALETLSTKYTSHSFVIDYIEAKALFNNVRLVNPQEAKLVESLGPSCRYPQGPVTIKAVTMPDVTEPTKKDAKNAKKNVKKRGSTTRRKASSPKTTSKPVAKRSKTVSRANGKNSTGAG